ncbi:hypothetical protein [Paenibacillus sp. PastH-2]|nr:hypothetical protein [Paenibacillus sp. PastH-2]MDH6480489.1 hypothetical protein [Paenibacillus sp. PastH-2]
MNILHAAMPRRQGQRSGVLLRGIAFLLLSRSDVPFFACAAKA